MAGLVEVDIGWDEALAGPDFGVFNTNLGT